MEARNNILSNNHPGKVSICIPTYNRPKLIACLLESILEQSFSNWEVIITDNSENDLTAEVILNRYSISKIRYIKNEQNIGMGGNVRRALDYVTGDYFTFTPDDDLWIDNDKLAKQVAFLSKYRETNIVYSNAKSINYSGIELAPFFSCYNDSPVLISAAELLPGATPKYFLNILTPLLRTDPLLNLFKESWFFESEEYFCYYLAAAQETIGFISDITVALREAEHYRTAVEDGKIVDWKSRKDIRIRQVLGFYSTLLALHPETREKLETEQVQNFLARHLLSQAKASRSLVLMIQTLFACQLHFRKFSIPKMLKVRSRPGKSFG